MNIDMEGVTCVNPVYYTNAENLSCGKPARCLVWNKDKKAYPLCMSCADHNVKNRRGIVIAFAE